MGWKKFKQNRWFKVISNMYVLVLTLFLIWMAFFDTNSILLHYELRKEVKRLKDQADFFEKQIAKDKKEWEKLSNPDSLEKFAREQYYMKKDNEEIFLIEHEDSLKQ